MENKSSQILNSNFCLASVMIEITTACNYKCVHCYLGKRDGCFRPDYLPYETILSIVEQLKELRTFKVCLTGGEPFCHPRINDILELLRDNNFLVYILTNASRINAGNIGVLRNRVNKILTTCYGNTRETYESVTQLPGSYSKYKEAIRLLHENKIACSERGILLRENSSEVHEFSRRCKNVESYICVDCYDKYVQPHLVAPSVIKEYYSDLIDDNAEVRRQMLDFVIDEDTYVCAALTNSLFITVNGNITPCANFNYPIGNIYSDKLTDIWKKDDISTIREQFKAKCFKKCFSCEYLKYNLNMCPANYLYETGDMYLPSQNTCQSCKVLYDVINTTE